MKYRLESDSLGERQIPAEVYYGIQTARAIQNFPMTGITISQFPNLINALASVKKAAAMANMELGILDHKIGDAIVQACDDVRSGALFEHFIVDVIQGGAGTSTNMNANEVIANRALEIMGHKRGEYQYCHPNNHVNLSQSTNDVYPTALKIASVWDIEKLLKAMNNLKDAFTDKGQEFSDVLKIGRTQLQDAVPMTLGQEFEAYGIALSEGMKALKDATREICGINMGATAVGTGINTVEGYAEKVRFLLADITGLPLYTEPNLVEATSDTGAFVQLSGVLKRVAIKLSKVCNDLRLLSSGPRAGIGEINLPPRQPGSSIMPGKVNPVIPEVVNQVCFQVIGNDVTVTLAAEGGQLELNVFEPILGFNIFQSIEMLERACTVLRERCVVGITANRERCQVLVENSVSLVTALAPFMGHEDAAAIAKKALETGRPVRQLALESGLIDEEKLNEILDPRKMTHPRSITGYGKI
jgi:aspartate ammonia-lyase